MTFAEGPAAEAAGAALSNAELADLDGRSGEDGYAYDDVSLAPLVRLSRAIRVTSMASDGLFDVQDLAQAPTRSELVGFVELGLDYRFYDEQLVRSVLIGSAATALTFLVLMLVGRIALRRAVRPLVELQAPLRQLAAGDPQIDIPVSEHREIAAIAQTLRHAVASILRRDRSLRRLANYDDLTGLPNRRHFEELLAEALSGSAPADRDADADALLFLDLDHFKYINDTLGHTAGDIILRQVAARLAAAVSKDDVVARFGGDEFMLLLRDVSMTEARQIAERLLAEIRDYPLVFERRSFNLNGSVGISRLVAPYTVDEVLAQADMACHQAKQDGRNLVRVFEPAAGALEVLQSDLDQLGKLKTALREDRFELFFQPILCLHSGEFSHHEVLLRLRDGDQLRSPGSFLSAATRFGLMRDIDRWVIGNALERLALLRKEDPSVRFTVNVSGASFDGGDLDQFVQQTLQRHRLPPSAVVFEITEQVAVGSFADASRQIRSLMDLGCEFAIDDFGAGYSSLNYLKQLPMQYIKIDGTFIGKIVDSPVDQVIVRSIAEIARTLHKKTVAEFVGDQATLEMVERLGIDYVQGFHVGMPGPSVSLAGPRRAVG
ncbi:MAG: EAL domain-containing protein [Pseudomonadales bacterium]